MATTFPTEPTNGDPHGSSNDVDLLNLMSFLNLRIYEYYCGCPQASGEDKLKSSDHIFCPVHRASTGILSPFQFFFHCSLLEMDFNYFYKGLPRKCSPPRLRGSQ